VAVVVTALVELDGATFAFEEPKKKKFFFFNRVQQKQLTWPHLLKRCPARIIWKAYFRMSGGLPRKYDRAACSSKRADRRSSSCREKFNTYNKEI